MCAGDKGARQDKRQTKGTPPRKRQERKTKTNAPPREKTMKDKRENVEEARAIHFNMVAAWFTFAQQRKECHVRFDASVGVHSQSLGHRHVGNPATASVAQTLW